MSIKILVSYKNEHRIIQSDILVPIQTGRAIADKYIEGIIGDDTGDNISHKNEIYSEITAQYWAWKNYEQLGDPDYIGFMHYRRHFLFNKKKYNGNGHWVNFDRISEEYLNESNLNNSHTVSEIVKRNDIITGHKYHLKNSLKNNFNESWGFKVADFHLMFETVKQMYPEFTGIINETSEDNYIHPCNMYIMRKDLFFKYNEFLFPILFALENKIDASMYGANSSRLLGYFSECLLTLFLKIIKLEDNVKIKHFFISFIENTSVEYSEIIKPCFTDNYVPIVFCCNDFYVPYLLVVIQSLVEHSSIHHNYDIIIFTKDISVFNRKLLRSTFSTTNISIRFVLGKFDALAFKKTKISNVSSSYILYVPFILQKYNKVICLSNDTLIQHDIYELYKQNLNNCVVGACIDPYVSGLCNNTTLPNYLNFKNYNYSYNEYVESYLNLKDSYNYINNGVFVINLNKLDIGKYKDNLYKYSNKKFLFDNQDILNIIFRDDIYLLDLSWNTLTNDFGWTTNDTLRTMPLPILKQYEKAKQQPKIIHYAGEIKPWNLYNNDHTTLEFNYLWWDVARRTPLYEVILTRLQQFNSNSIKILLYPKLKRAYIRYKILSKLGFTKRYRNRYKEKRRITRDKINYVKHLKKTLLVI